MDGERCWIYRDAKVLAWAVISAFVCGLVYFGGRVEVGLFTGLEKGGLHNEIHTFCGVCTTIFRFLGLFFTAQSCGRCNGKKERCLRGMLTVVKWLGIPAVPMWHRTDFLYYCIRLRGEKTSYQCSSDLSTRTKPGQINSSGHLSPTCR